MSHVRLFGASRRKGEIRSAAVVLAGALVVAGCSSSGGSSTAAAGPSPTSSSSKGSCPTGSATGATSSQVTVAITVIDVSLGSINNATYGLPTAAEQENDWNLVADNINSAGGAGCRKIVVKTTKVNSADPTAAQQACLQIAASRPWAVIDVGALTAIGASNCIPAHKIPLIAQGLSQDQLTKYSPYDILMGDIDADTIRTGVLALKQGGYFSAAKGFKKLGLFYHNCTPTKVTAEQDALKEAGVSGGQLVSFNLGCPNQTDTTASLQQAVLTFKNAGVTHVTNLDVARGTAPFTQVADQQGFKPQYLFSDLAVATGATTGSNTAAPANLDGAVDILSGAYGEQTTPGYKLTGASQKCNAIFTAAGKPSLYDQKDGYGGIACDYLWFVQALLNHTTTLKASSLTAEMHSIGLLDLSYPGVPVDFSAAPPGSGYGVSQWRLVKYAASCKCWQVPDPAFHPAFK